MDDFDDYFTDDIVLDDQTIAILDQEEQKFLTQADFIRPAKRLKTAIGWNSASLANIDDAPEIEVHGDGSYAIDRTVQTRALFNNVPTAVPSALQSGGNDRTAKYKTTPHCPFTANEHLNSQELRQRTFNAPPDIPASSRRPPLRPQHNRSLRTGPNPLEDHVKDLQQKLEELRNENVRMQAALKEATEARMSRDGEVSVLKKNMERTVQTHAERLAKLTAAKEEADAKQLQKQKDMKEEIERLKTQFVFKQYEMEAMRRPPTTVRAKKTWKDPPMTPMAIPPQMRGWNQPQHPESSRSGLGAKTPIRPIQNPIPMKLSPRKFDHTSPVKKTASLPGFQNAFADSEQKSHLSRLPTWGEDLFKETRLHTGEQKQSVLQSPIRSQTLRNIEILPHLEDALMLSPSNKTRPTSSQASNGEGDTEQEDLEILEPHNWKAELIRIILTHHLSSTSDFTFQLLLGLPTVSFTSTESSKNYVAACAGILEAISNSTNGEDYELCLGDVSRALFVIVNVLTSSTYMLPLGALMKLLTTLTTSLPNFGIVILSQRDPSKRHILNVLCDFIETKFMHSTEFEHKSLVISETLSFIEILCYNTEDESVAEFTVIPMNKKALETLVDASQPSWVLSLSCRVLLSLASHRTLAHALLGIKDPMNVQTHQQSKENSKSAYIESLCLHLIDFTREDDEFVLCKSYILAFFAMLTISDPEIQRRLVNSYPLIPSIIVLITHLTTPIWEEDEQFLASKESTARMIRTCHQTLLLLHHLVFGLESGVDLRQMLQHTSRRPFNGLTHMFIVTFGRLGHADPPDQIENQFHSDLERISSIASEILSTVVDGPELDSVWSAFQTDPDDDTEMDEGEMEASLLGD